MHLNFINLGPIPTDNLSLNLEDLFPYKSSDYEKEASTTSDVALCDINTGREIEVVHIS